MASEAFQLALLLTLKDAASGGLDRFEAKLRAAGKAGESYSKQLDDIREDLNKDLAAGGVGLAGLKIIKDGVQAAGDYQSVMTDLRASLAQTGTDGKVNLNKLAEEMVGAEAVAVRLGNKLPGTTADFAQMMQVLKQNGLDTTTIMNGAADAVANLAVASNAVPRELAIDFARYGNLFKLKPEEFTPAADVFSRINSSTGQTAGELVEAAKYFQGRIGQGLQIGGLEDAQKYTRLFGFMGKRGITGSVAGAGLSNFFESYNVHRDKLDDLQKSTGIKLDFFDKGGKFVGLDQVMEQMSQFDKLSAKDRTEWMEKIFGTLGSQAANVMIDSKGWKEFNTEQEKTISLADKTAMKAKDYNIQMEALSGTLTNLKVAIFEPMLPGMTSAIEKANQLVGVIQGFAKSHPDIAKYGVSFLAVGSAALVAYSGIKAVITGVRLLKMASAFSKTEGLLGYMTQTSAATTTVTKNVSGLTAKQAALQQLGGTIVATDSKAKNLGTSVATTGGKVAGLKKDLFSLNNVFKAVLVLEAIGFTWDQISKLKKTIDDWRSMNTGLDETGKSSHRLYQSTPAEQRDPRGEAVNVLRLLEAGNKEFQVAVDPKRQSWTDYFTKMGGDRSAMFRGGPTTTEIIANPQLNARAQQILQMPYRERSVAGAFSNPYERVSAETAAVKNLRERAPSLSDPQVMTSFRRDVMPTMGFGKEQTGFVNQLLQQAFPESFSQSLSGISEQGKALSETLTSLQQPIAGTAELFTGLPPALTPVGQAFTTLPQPMTDTATAFGALPQPIGDVTGAFQNLVPPASRLPGSFNNVFTSANNLAISIDGVSAKIAAWQPPASPTAASPGGAPGVAVPPMFGMPGRAVGGVVERDGIAYVHAGNVITPAGVTRGLSGFSELMSLARSRPGQTQNFPFPSDITGNAATQTNAGLNELFAGPSVRQSPPSLSASNAYSAGLGLPSLFERVGEIQRERNVTDRSSSESSRFEFDRNMLREVYRGGDGSGSASASVVINAPITITMTDGGDSGSTEQMLQKALASHLKKIESTVSEQLATKRLDRRMGKSVDNGRLRA